MSWLKIDDGFCEHSKIVGLTSNAFRLHVAALCLCARLLTDGKITEQHLRKIGADLPFNPRRYVDELVTAKLWNAYPNCWKIKDYLDYNPSSTQVKERRIRNAERQAKHRVINRDIHRSNAVTNVVSNTAPSRPVSNTRTTTTVLPEDVTSLEDVAAVIDLTERVHNSFGGIA